MKSLLVSALALISLAGCGSGQSLSDVQSRRHGEAKPRIAYALNASLGDVTTAYAPVHLSASQHDGIGMARNEVYVTSCSCYKWTGTPYRV